MLDPPQHGKAQIGECYLLVGAFVPSEGDAQYCCTAGRDEFFLL